MSATICQESMSKSWPQVATSSLAAIPATSTAKNSPFSLEFTGLSTFSLWVVVPVKNFPLTLPEGLAAKDFMDRHGFSAGRAAFMQMLNRNPTPRRIVLFILHSVPPIP